MAPKPLPARVFLRITDRRYAIQATASEKPGSVTYEPAVPKCATCEHYDSKRVNTVGKAYCVVLEKYSACAIPVPPDGSGYCHNHPDNATTEPKSKG